MFSENVKQIIECFEREIEIGGAFRCAIEISPARIRRTTVRRRRASNRKDKRRMREERAANRDKSELGNVVYIIVRRTLLP